MGPGVHLKQYFPTKKKDHEKIKQERIYWPKYDRVGGAAGIFTVAPDTKGKWNGGIQTPGWISNLPHQGHTFERFSRHHENDGWHGVSDCRNVLPARICKCWFWPFSGDKSHRYPPYDR